MAYDMNSKLLLKTLVLLAILLLLVVIGMNNPQKVDLRLPPLVQHQSLPAALMYFAFFAVGLLSGTILTAGKKGGGGGGGGGSRGKG